MLQGLQVSFPYLPSPSFSVKVSLPVNFVQMEFRWKHKSNRSHVLRWHGWFGTSMARSRSFIIGTSSLGTLSPSVVSLFVGKALNVGIWWQSYGDHRGQQCPGHCQSPITQPPHHPTSLDVTFIVDSLIPNLFLGNRVAPRVWVGSSMAVFCLHRASWKTPSPRAGIKAGRWRPEAWRRSVILLLLKKSWPTILLLKHLTSGSYVLPEQQIAIDPVPSEDQHNV